MENTNTTFTFVQDQITYESTANGRFFGTVPGGKKTRIGKKAYEAAFKQYMAGHEITEEEVEEKVEQVEESMTTEEIKEIKTEIKKTSKPKTKKVQTGGMEFSEDGISIILTPKQVDFIKHLPDTCFWEHGVESCIWVDCLCDEINGQFTAKPMTVGAMISTLCEKGLGVRAKGKVNGRTATSFALTELGQKIATKLGL